METNDPLLLLLYAIITGIFSIIPTLIKQKVGKKTLSDILKAQSKNFILLSRTFTLLFIGYFIYSVIPKECKVKSSTGPFTEDKVYKPSPPYDLVKVGPYFGIQVFSGDDICRTISVAEDFSNSPFGDPLIKVKFVNNLKRYALVLGKFNDREVATEVKKLITRYYSDKLEYIRDPFIEFYGDKSMEQKEELINRK